MEADLTGVAVVLGVFVGLLDLFMYMGRGSSVLKDLYQKTPFGARRSAYAKLQRLHAGVQVDHFSEVLGFGPLFRNPLTPLLEEQIFVHPLFYVQAITEPNGKVAMYAVTGRNEKFMPMLWPNTVHPDSHPRPHPGRLGRETFEQISKKGPQGISLFVRGATAPTYYVEAFYMGNPGLYQTYLVGFNECGPFTVGEGVLSALLGRPVQLGLLAGDDSFNDEGLASWLAQPNAKALRSTGRPNTYGIATVRGALRAVEGSRIGPNYIQTRTIPE